MPENENQPWLPRVRMIWLFVLVTAMAILLLVIRSASDGASVAFAAVFLGAFLLMLTLVCATTFLAAYALGRLERNWIDEPTKVSSPFAYNQLPEQIVPPVPIERI